VHHAEQRRHLVHFYTEEESLAREVSRYLAEGLRQAEYVMAIATGGHGARIRQELENGGVDVESAMAQGRFVCCDAQEMLGRFLVDGRPDRKRFEETVGARVRELRREAGGCGLRAYGEMVDVLWNSGHSAAAIQLEQYWNELLESEEFGLLCAYQIDVFGTEFQTGVLDGVLRAHTHVVPARENGDLSEALSAAMEEVLGTRPAGAEFAMRANFRTAWAAVPDAEARVLWLRSNLPDFADEILVRARHYYEAALETAEAEVLFVLNSEHFFLIPNQFSDTNNPWHITF
jgi:hypothetical protein